MSKNSKASLYGRQYYKKADSASPTIAEQARSETSYDKAGIPVKTPRKDVTKRYIAEYVYLGNRSTYSVSSFSEGGAMNLAYAKEAELRRGDRGAKLVAVYLGNRKVWARR